LGKKNEREEWRKAHGKLLDGSSDGGLGSSHLYDGLWVRISEVGSVLDLSKGGVLPASRELDAEVDKKEEELVSVGKRKEAATSKEMNSRSVGLLLQVEQGGSTSTDLASVGSDGNGNSDDNSILELSDDLGELSLESRDESGLSSKSNLVGSLSLRAIEVTFGSKSASADRGDESEKKVGREERRTNKETSPAWARASSGPPHETMISRSRDPPAPMRDRWNCGGKETEVSERVRRGRPNEKSDKPGAQSKRCYWSPLQRSQRQREWRVWQP